MLFKLFDVFNFNQFGINYDHKFINQRIYLPVPVDTYWEIVHEDCLRELQVFCHLSSVIFAFLQETKKGLIMTIGP